MAAFFQRIAPHPSAGCVRYCSSTLFNSKELSCSATRDLCTGVALFLKKAAVKPSNVSRSLVLIFLQSLSFCKSHLLCANRSASLSGIRGSALTMAASDMAAYRYGNKTPACSVTTPPPCMFLVLDLVGNCLVLELSGSWSVRVRVDPRAEKLWVVFPPLHNLYSLLLWWEWYKDFGKRK